MNILFINNFPLPNAGGVGRVSEVLSKEFISKGHKVNYVALRNGNDYEHNGVKQYFTGNDKVYSKQNINYLKRYLISEKIDIIINQGGTKRNVIRTVEKANIFGIKLITVFHGSVKKNKANYENIIKENFKYSRFRLVLTNSLSLWVLRVLSNIKHRRDIKKAIATSNKFVLLSEGYINDVKFFLPKYDTKKVIFIPNPLFYKINELSTKNKENRLIYVGRINYSEKQTYMIADLWNKINHDFPNWSFDVVGDGPELKDLKERVKQMSLKRIYFHGYTDPKPFLEKAKVLCMTSSFEGFGMVLLEAQAHGVVPIAFNVTAGIRDIISDNINGILIQPYDLDKYTDSLFKLMTLTSYRNDLAETAINSANEFNSNKISDLWIKMFYRMNETKCNNNTIIDS